MIQVFGRNYFCQCQLLLLHEIQVEICTFQRRGASYKKLVCVTRENANDSTVHCVRIVAGVVRVESMLKMDKVCLVSTYFTLIHASVSVRVSVVS